ncbi:MAG: hypothetical protein KGL39_27520, partial [Patescibacteria group bacterium]|nr:hypothetical protein [Patescibacteria group bacterium]
MNKKVFLIIVILAAVVATMAATINYVPPLVGAMVSSDGTGNAGTWQPLSGSGGTSINYVPPYSGLMYSTDGTGNVGTWAFWKPTATPSGCVSGVSYPCTIPASSLTNPVLTGQTANVSLYTLYTTPSNGAGSYELSCYESVTTAGGSGAKMPQCYADWTDFYSGVPLPSGQIGFVAAFDGTSVGLTNLNVISPPATN